MPSIAELAYLNEIDLVVDGLKARQAQINQALREPETVTAARAALAAAETALQAARTVQKSCEADVQRATERLARTEARLYSGQVRNPRELENAEQDVAQLKRQRSQAEDTLLEALLEVEAATERHSTAQAAWTQHSTSWEATQATLRGELAQVTARLSGEAARQAATRRNVPADLLAVYDRLRGRRGGRAVARLEDGACTACQVDAPPSKVQAIRDASELVYCDNCGRLLWTE